MQAKVVSLGQLQVLKDSIQQHLAMIRLLQRGTENMRLVKNSPVPAVREEDGATWLSESLPPPPPPSRSRTPRVKRSHGDKPRGIAAAVGNLIEYLGIRTAEDVIKELRRACARGLTVLSVA